jgi:hypothetical protein
MTSSLDKELYRAAAMTFEGLGFLFPTPESEEQHAGAPARAAAGVEFRGPFDGRLVVTIRGEVLPIIAANMLGIEERPSENEQHDALCEIANVICGNVLPRIAGPREVFQIQAPESADPSSPPPGHPAAGRACVPLDEGVAEVDLYITRGAASGGGPA